MKDCYKNIQTKNRISDLEKQIKNIENNIKSSQKSIIQKNIELDTLKKSLIEIKF